MKRSPLPPRRAWIRRRTKPKKVNRKRKASEFARCYHSRKRVAFVKSLPCIGCGVVGYSENAHVVIDGAGRKADYGQVVPLCGPHYTKPLVPSLLGTALALRGCHNELHQMGRAAWELYRHIDLDEAAARTETAWQSHVDQDLRR